MNISNSIPRLIPLAYPQRAAFVLSRIFTEFPLNSIEKKANKAYTLENFKTMTIAPIFAKSDNQYILELWHGPTNTYHDIYAQFLPFLLPENVLAAVDGDSCAAMLKGYRNVEHSRIIAFFPRNDIAEFQQLKIVTQKGDNFMAVGVDGDMAEIQEKAAQIAKDSPDLSTLDSVPKGRSAPLVACYFSAYCALVEHKKIKVDDKISFLLNKSDSLLAESVNLARELGLPVSTDSAVTLTLEAENPNEIEETFEIFKKSPIASDAICRVENMADFVNLML
ncbi:MAG: hypothetical protein LBL34_03985 [Clostridiales bacterium]|jgi:threonine synthase|nr:hypothetical protein [Clostridiales bacterium]